MKKLLLLGLLLAGATYAQDSKDATKADDKPAAEAAKDSADAAKKDEGKKEEVKEEAKKDEAKAEDKKDEAKAEDKKEEAKAEDGKAAEAKAEDKKDDAKGGDDKCKAVVEGNDAMAFNVSEININKADCPEFTIELKHVGEMPKETMGHNVVVTKAADKDAVVGEGAEAGLEKDYVKDDDKRVLAHTKLIGGKESAEVKFKTEGFEAGGDYDFFCSYPGHASMMTGKVVVK